MPHFAQFVQAEVMVSTARLGLMLRCCPYTPSLKQVAANLRDLGRLLALLDLLRCFLANSHIYVEVSHLALPRAASRCLCIKTGPFCNSPCG